MKRILYLIIFWFLQIPQSPASEPQPLERADDSITSYLTQADVLIYNDFPRAIELLQKADSLAALSNNKEDLTKVAYSHGVAYYVKGDYGVSLQYFLDATENFRELGDKLGIAKGLVGQGLIQQGIDRHEEAMNLFEEAIEAYKEADNYSASNPAYLNIAISEIELGEFSAARKNLGKAIELSREANRKGVEHLAFNKLAEIHLTEGDLETAIQYYERVLFDDVEPNGWEKSFAHAGLAKAYLKQGEIDLAKEHGLFAMEFAKNAHSLWDLERNSGILSEIYASNGEMNKAFNYLQLNQKYKDSLYNQAKLREINLLQLESKEAENRRLQAEKEVAEKRLFFNKIITFLFVLFSLFLLLLLVLFRKKRKQKELFGKELEEKNRTILEQNELITKRNEELDQLNKSKDRLFSILSHDLKSPIGSIQQLLEMIKSGEFTPEEQAELLDEMLKQISATSFLLHNLLYWGSSQLTGSKGKPELVNLRLAVEKALDVQHWPAKQKEVTFEHVPIKELENVLVDKDQLSVILQNLISNAIKFTKKGTIVTIEYKEEREKILLCIRDQGKGISQERIEEIKNLNTRMISEPGTCMETGTGLGLLLVKEFLKLNNADLEIKSEPGEGSEFIISFLKGSEGKN